MKLETVKSFILFVLIGISILLSYTLWSYQPNSGQTIGGEIVDNELDVAGSSNESSRSLIKPTDIIFHKDGAHYGFREPRNQDRMYEDMQEWVITNFEESDEVSADRPSEGVEIIFSDEIPMEILDKLFNFGPEDIVFPDWSMKRVFISFIHDSKSLQVDFLSEDSNHQATALINAAETYQDLSDRIDDLNEKMLREFLVINEGENPIYIPAGNVKILTYSITPIEIRPALFVNILFTNPAVVRETNSQTIGEVYFTDNRQMSVYQNGMRMEYISHVTTTDDSMRTLSEKDLLEHSISNINSHSGWTDKYRLEDINLDLNRITFQMYYEGYPVYNYMLANIQQRWDVYQNSLQLIEYDRPLYRLGSKLLQREVDDLPRGEDVLSYLESNSDISLQNIQDVKIGYELKYQQDDQESEYIELDPAWYKKENNVWQKITFNEQTAPRGGN